MSTPNPAHVAPNVKQVAGALAHSLREDSSDREHRQLGHHCDWMLLVCDADVRDAARAVAGLYEPRDTHPGTFGLMAFKLIASAIRDTGDIEDEKDVSHAADLAVARLIAHGLLVEEPA